MAKLLHNPGAYPSSVWMFSPVVTFHTRIVLPYDGATINSPSGLNEARSLVVREVSRILIHCPVEASQMRMVLSSDAETINFPSGLNLAELTPGWYYLPMPKQLISRPG